MAYNYCYSLYLKKDKERELLTKILKELKGTEKFPILSKAFNEDGTMNDFVIWNEEEEEMKKISKMYPEHTFILYGEGEYSDDKWTSKYLNGTMLK